MEDIIAAAEVEEMLTPERCDAFGFGRQPTADEVKHLEDAYLYKFERKREKVMTFFTQTGTVLKRSRDYGRPSREQVEALLEEMECDAETVIQFLHALQNLTDIATKNGNPSRDDCARFLRCCDKEEEQAMNFMKSIWKMANPKPPKAPAKGSKKPPQPHLAAACGFPNKAEAEWALRTTRADDKAHRPLDTTKAVELLSRLSQFDEERQAQPERYGDVDRTDIVWALDPNRCERYVKDNPLTHEEYTTGNSPASILLTKVGHLLAVASQATMETTNTISQETRKEVWGAIEKFDFNREQAEKYIRGVKVMMTKQDELGIESREEVDSIMESQGYDDLRVLQLMQDMAQLQKQKTDLGTPSRAEIKEMLLVAWEDPDRLATAAACLKTYRGLLTDDAQMMSIFGHPPTEEDKTFIRVSAFRFQGNREKVETYMKNVSEILHQGDAVGNPTRQQVVDVMNECNLDPRAAHRKLREVHWALKDAQLKEEYRKNRDKAKGE
uniref:Uncharacterized protein n=1 Tax=Haptolina ericina TaxID=156174 RepID=A0A7S3AZQ2_9EUKA